MSEALEKVSGIRHLPIFPLPLVMLPNEIVPLHIFEERYRQMLKDIEKKGNLFGITYADPVDDVIDKPPPGTVGCVAEVREADLLADGRSNIITLGIIRFRLIDYVGEGTPYFIGEVEFFEDEREDASALDRLAEEVFVLFERVAKAAFKMGGSRGRFPEVQRTDPESLSFLVTAAFSFDNERKYRLLEMTSTTERLTELKEILDRTVGQMEETADISTVSRTNGHSKKKIDL